MLKGIFFTAFILIIASHTYSQEQVKSKKEAPSSAKAKQMPEFPGGEIALNNFVKKNLVYPESAKKDSLEGKVHVSFVVSITGEVSDVKVFKSVRADLDQEAIRVIRSMPNWKPGSDKGKPIPVRFALPLVFKLSN